MDQLLVGRLFGDAVNLWGPPEHDEAWHARMRADPSVKAVVETFIRDMLPRAREDFRVQFVTEAERVAPGLTSAFLAAAATAVHYGVTHTYDAIAEGALHDIEGFEAIVDTAIAVRTPSAADLQRYAETHLAIANGEYSEDYAEHLSDNEDGFTAGEFLEAYVQRVRATVGWRHIAEHRHRDRLLYGQVTSDVARAVVAEQPWLVCDLLLRAMMSQKSSLPQVIQSVSEALMPNRRQLDQRGVTLLASKAVGAPFVGTAAACLHSRAGTGAELR